MSLSDNARTHGATVVDISPSEGLPFEPQVEVVTRPATAAYFLIRDNGPGIEPEFIPHIFEKFEKRGTASGTGLGLYLAKLMVEGIDGSISVETGPRRDHHGGRSPAECPAAEGGLMTSSTATLGGSRAPGFGLAACGGQGVSNSEVEVGEFWISPGNGVLQAGRWNCWSRTTASSPTRWSLAMLPGLWSEQPI